MAFLLTTLTFLGPAGAHVPLWAPRVSLSLALDWNKLTVAAITRPKRPAEARAARHSVPKTSVTAAAPAPLQRVDFAAYGRVETAMRAVVTPHYMEPDLDHRQMFRVVYLAPFTPYFGAWGALLTIETNALLR